MCLAFRCKWWRKFLCCNTAPVRFHFAANLSSSDLNRVDQTAPSRLITVTNLLHFHFSIDPLHRGVKVFWKSVSTWVWWCEDSTKLQINKKTHRNWLFSDVILNLSPIYLVIQSLLPGGFSIILFWLHYVVKQKPHRTPPRRFPINLCWLRCVVKQKSCTSYHTRLWMIRYTRL